MEWHEEDRLKEQWEEDKKMVEIPERKRVTEVHGKWSLAKGPEVVRRSACLN